MKIEAQSNAATNDIPSLDRARPTCADAAGVSLIEADPTISWISARPDYWPLPDGTGAPPSLIVPDSVLGVMCLIFGVGAGGADWIAHLARSAWFAGLEPRMEDMLGAGGASTGCWTISDGSAGRGRETAAMAEACFAQAPLPDAPLAMVAVPRGAEPSELAAVLGLVGALRERRGVSGCRMAVVVTVEAGASCADSAFERGLLDRGAFVVRAGMGATGDHLHHFPLRAAVIPRTGRLVCVDLADYLACWRPGAMADLHVIPCSFDEAALALGTLLTAAEGSSVSALNLHLHLDLDAPGNHLVELDQLATCCREFFLGPEDGMVFTTADRLDGVTGLADLLVVHG